MSAPARIEIEEIAARWIIRREERNWSDSDQSELDAWLDESMAHKAAYWRLEHGWRQADRIGSLGDDGTVARFPFRARALTRFWRPAAVAASLALALVAGSQLIGPSHVPVETAQQQTLATKVGGRKIVPLKDGSRIELNTATVMRAAVSEERREVWLDQGEAYFEVRHSDTVPFVVHAGSRDVTVLGTKFIVRRDGSKVTVSVVEGRVRVDEVSPVGASASSSTVVTGDVAIVDGRSTLVATKAPEKIESALAWRDGMLSFDQSTLADAASEFNRYNAKKLVVTDDETARIRIGGTFQASNVDAFVRLLRDAYGLDVSEANGEVKISR